MPPIHACLTSSTTMLLELDRMVSGGIVEEPFGYMTRYVGTRGYPGKISILERNGPLRSDQCKGVLTPQRIAPTYADV